MRKVSTIALLVIGSISVMGQKPEIYNTKAGAIRGYDPVAYFVSGKAEKGDSLFTQQYKGADWYFTSAENLETFKANPEKYIPQFGGYCAYAVSQNYTYAGDPLAFTVVDGKLYLNASPGVAKKWSANREEYIQSANTNWPAVLNK